jgi:hypothetical protein
VVLSCDRIVRRLDDYLDRASGSGWHRIALPPGLLSAVSARLTTECSDAGGF